MIVDGVEYDVIPAVSVAASKMLVDTYERLGKPEDPFSDQGEKVMGVIIAIWQDLYPSQAKDWLEQRKEYQSQELSIREQVKGQTGRSLASIPMPVYRLIKKVFPTYRMSNRDDFIKLVNKYPMFRMANKV